MTALTRPTAFFERVPVEIIGNILDHLNQVTGSKGIINKADIPVVMRYVRSLACTSKTMAFYVNHPDVACLFLKSLSHKYLESEEYFAAVFNTIGARKWIWSYIKEKGDDKAYQAIQEIYELASDVLEEAKDAGPTFEYSEGRKNWPSPSPSYCQTKQGFFLYIDGFPSHLATPFGEITIYGPGIASRYAPLSVAEVFIRRLNAVFERVIRRNLSIRDDETVHEIAVSSGKDTLRHIRKEEIRRIGIEELEKKQGTQCLIKVRLGGSAVYKIREVKGKKVPDAVWHDPRISMRSSELITRIWEMLEADRLGKDPIANKIEHQRVIPKSEDIERILFNNISEVSQWGIERVAKLERQPIFLKKTWRSLRGSYKTKTLALEHSGEARIIEILNGAAGQFLDEDSKWDIHAPGWCGDCRISNNRDENQEIELWIREKSKPCDLSVLKTAYDSVIKNLGRHWVKSRLEDYPAIFYAESEEDYVLFVKKEPIVQEEDILIRFLAGPLGLSKSISCYRDWKDGDSSGLYLWVKKNHLEKVLAALNINLNNEFLA